MNRNYFPIPNLFPCVSCLLKQLFILQFSRKFKLNTMVSSDTSMCITYTYVSDIFFLINSCVHSHFFIAKQAFLCIHKKILRAILSKKLRSHDKATDKIL